MFSVNNSFFFAGVTVLCLLVLAQTTAAKVVTFDWDVTWVKAAPDGLARPVIGINNEWPLPAIVVNLGDNIIVNVRNMLGNETTGFHWHGQYQKGSNTMEGPQGVVQCGIPPGDTFTYNFIAEPAGSFWYHSHTKGQYPDGLRGALIVKDPEDPFAGKYQKELTLTLSDWYHSQMPDLLESYLSTSNPSGAEPVPNSTLVNDALTTKFDIIPGQTYRLRIINIAAFAAHYVQIDDHEMTIIMVDGVYTVPQKTSSIFITAAQRYDVLFTALNSKAKNYALISSIDQSMFNGYPDLPQIIHANATGYLVYDAGAPLPPPLSVPDFDPFDDFKLVPYDKQPILGPVDHTITLNMIFNVDDNGINRAYINNQTYVTQIVPTLYTALSAPSAYVMNPVIYGVASNPFVLKSNEIVEVVINNYDNGGHPWHMHGHALQIVARSKSGVGPYNGVSSGFPATPMRRDTIMVADGGYAVFRFKADNPGIYLIHCHIDWHVEAGLTATMIEAPDHLQIGYQNLKIPADHQKACRVQGIPTAGNAAGNTNKWLDLAGARTKPELRDYGSLINPKISRVRRGDARLSGGDAVFKV